MIRRTTTIDIGSTNSQIGILYEESLDNGVTWRIKSGPKLLVDNNHLHGDYPTVILRKEDQLDENKNYLNNSAFFGVGALQVAATLHAPKLITNFKKDFLVANDQFNDEKIKEQHDRACIYYEMYLGYLRRMLNNYTKEYDNYFERTIITLPVFAISERSDELKEIAIRAGWTNIEIMDEANGVLFYYLNKNPALIEHLRNQTTIMQTVILLVDVGGSTTDLMLVKLRADGNGGYEGDHWKWPDIGVKDHLGGIEIDKQLSEWLIDNNWILRELAEKEIRNNGYRAFASFKEKISRRLCVGQDVTSLGGGELAGLQYDPQSGIGVKKGEDSKITQEIFMKEIVRTYLQKQSDAIRELLVKSGTSENEIDFICLSGGGSLLFGYKEMLLGKLGIDNPLNFYRIQSNRILTSADGDNPSAICALGNVMPRIPIPFKYHCPHEIGIQIQVYCVKVDIASEMSKKMKAQNANNEVSDFASDGTNGEALLLLDKKVRICERNCPLPFSNNDEISVELKYRPKVNYIVCVTLLSENENGLHIHGRWIDLYNRNPGLFFQELTGYTNANNTYAVYKIKYSIDENRVVVLDNSFSIEGYGLFSAWNIIGKKRKEL